MDVTRASLLSRVRDPSNHEAWREFERSYRELVLRYCARRGLQPTDREDVLQRVLLKMYQVLPRFTYDPARGRFRDYLYRAVRTAISDHTARLQSHPAAVDKDVLETSVGPQMDELWEQEWVDHHYRLAISSLRESFEARSVQMFERLLAGEPVESVARQHDTTAAAVHKVKQRIRDRLKELIEEQVREEDRV